MVGSLEYNEQLGILSAVFSGVYAQTSEICDRLCKNRTLGGNENLVFSMIILIYTLNYELLHTVTRLAQIYFKHFYSLRPEKAL